MLLERLDHFVAAFQALVAKTTRAARRTWARRADPHVAAPQSDKAHDDEEPIGELPPRTAA
jgi:hypothetical protein